MSERLRRVARTAIRAYLTILAGAAGLAARVSQRRPSVTPQRILVIRLDLLGDVLYSLSALSALRERYPEAQVDMLVLPYTAPLARASRVADRVIELDTNRIRSIRGLIDINVWREYIAVWRSLRSRRYDVAISVAGRTASLVAVLSDARRRIGYANEAYPYTLTDPVPGGRFERRMPEVGYVMRLLEPLGIRATPSTPVLQIGDHARSTVAGLLELSGIMPDARVVVVHAGSVNGSAKRWPVDRWAAFSKAVHEIAGARIVLTGSGGDRELAEAVVRLVGDAVVSLCGRTTVDELLALLERADLVASGDSGPLHLAAALGRPVIGIYGPTDPRIHGPAFSVAAVSIHRYDLPCSPCYSLAATAECPLGDPICMRLVSVESVVAAAVDILSVESRR